MGKSRPVFWIAVAALLAGGGAVWAEHPRPVEHAEASKPFVSPAAVYRPSDEVPFDSHYNYVELRHDGAEDMPYPRIWLGATEDQVPLLDREKNIEDAFNARIILTSAKYQALLDVGKSLKCQNSVADQGWDEVTVTEITAGKREPGCILQGPPARAYLDRVLKIVGNEGDEREREELKRYKTLID